MKKIFTNLASNFRDSILSYILTKYKIENALLLYNIATISPSGIVGSLLASKFGIPPIIVMLILAFI